ncbi:MAG: tetratricopeptide repeat protein [Flavobacteriales bacterium]|nr:tetratricopeptide repeat protein [Flavobacteriales bacterium]
MNRTYRNIKSGNSKLLSIFLWTVILAVFSLTVEASGSDSLLRIWKNKQQPDSARLDAYIEFIWQNYLQSDPDTTLFIAAEICEQAHIKNCLKQRADGYKLMGSAFYLKSRFDDAERSYNKALAIYEQLHDRRGIARIKFSIGNVYRLKGNGNAALENYLLSSSICRKIGDSKGVADGLVGVGNIYLDQKNYSKALSYYEQAKEVYVELKQREQLAMVLNNMGNAHYYLGNENTSSKLFEESLEIKRELGKTSDVARTLQNLGGMALMNSQHERARSFYLRSLSISEGIQDKWLMSTTYADLGWLNYDLEKLDSAQFWCEKALRTAQSIGSIDKEQRACECLYEVHQELGNPKMALKYYVWFRDLKDSMNNQEIIRTLQQMEFDKRMYRDSIERAEEMRISTLRFTRTRNILITSGSFALLLAFGFWNRMRHHRRSQLAIAAEQEKSETLLLNILPAEVAIELKETGKATPRVFPDVAILFTDFKNFTQISEHIRAEDLIGELNYCFDRFDTICDKYGIEKIKTIGDSYMAACGLPQYDPEASRKTVLAGLEMIEVIKRRREERIKDNLHYFEMRCGIHTGNVVAGIVGHRKFQYDLWGDTVNTASRMESNGMEGKVNISQVTHQKIKDDSDFQFEFRGMVNAKGKGEIEMYFVETNVPVQVEIRSDPRNLS